MRKSFVRLVSLIAIAVVAAAVNVLGAAPASAGTANGKGALCTQYFAAVSCGYLNFDSVHKRVRAYGGIEDQSWGNTIVAVAVCIEHRPATYPYPPSTDHCGDRDLTYEKVSASSDLMYECSYTKEYRAVVLWLWDPIDTAPGVTGVAYSNWVGGYPWCI